MKFKMVLLKMLIKHDYFKNHHAKRQNSTCALHLDLFPFLTITKDRLAFVGKDREGSEKASENFGFIS